MKGLLSTLRKFPFVTLKPVYASIGEKKVPLLLIWGTCAGVEV